MDDDVLFVDDDHDDNDDFEKHFEQHYRFGGSTLLPPLTTPDSLTHIVSLVVYLPCQHQCSCPATTAAALSKWQL